MATRTVRITSKFATSRTTTDAHDVSLTYRGIQGSATLIDGQTWGDGPHCWLSSEVLDEASKRGELQRVADALEVAWEHAALCDPTAGPTPASLMRRAWEEVAS